MEVELGECWVDFGAEVHGAVVAAEESDGGVAGGFDVVDGVDGGVDVVREESEFRAEDADAAFVDGELEASFLEVGAEGDAAGAPAVEVGADACDGDGVWADGEVGHVRSRAGGRGLGR